MSPSCRTGLMLMLLFVSGRAHSHGGFQETLQVLFDGDEAESPVVRTTYGILRALGDGNWAWSCEEVAGSLGIADMVTFSSGRWIVGSFEGTRYSDDRCDWISPTNALTDLFVTAFEVDGDGVLWATTASGEAENGLWRSDDEGESYILAAIFGEGALLRDVQVGSGWTWVVGWRDDLPLAWVSADQSEWTEILLPSDDSPSSVRMMEVDAEGEGLVRMLVSGGSRLLEVSTDGQISTLFDLDEEIDALAVGPDAGHLVVGSRDGGAHESMDGGVQWAGPVESAPHIGCFAEHGEAWYACTHNWQDASAVQRAVQDGSALEEWGWEEVLWYGDVRGPEECEEGTTVANLCAPLWDDVAPAGGYDQDRLVEDTGTTPPPDDGCGCGGGSAAWFFYPLMWIGLGRLRRVEPSGRGAQVPADEGTS